MRRYAFLLYPLALIYDLVTRVRNRLFDWGLLKSTQSPIPSIIIGNLSVGGTGKTPMVEFLIGQLKKNHSIGTLSRGYGRKTSGFIRADHPCSPEEIGDEPFQLFSKFSDIEVYVGENRVEALQRIKAMKSPPNLILLDDAFQHRYVKADLTILLTTYSHPFFSDHLLPMGRLRENRGGAKRADLILVTKSPSALSLTDKEAIKRSIYSYSTIGTPVVFSSIAYGTPVPLYPGLPFSGKVILLSGIAHNSQLIDYVNQTFGLIETLVYPDHHFYTDVDFARIKTIYLKHKGSNPVVLTTEKDAVKVKSDCPKGFLAEIPIFVLPIQVVFSPDDGQILNKLIQQKVLQKDRTK